MYTSKNDKHWISVDHIVKIETISYKCSTATEIGDGDYKIKVSLINEMIIIAFKTKDQRDDVLNELVEKL